MLFAKVSCCTLKATSPALAETSFHSDFLDTKALVVLPLHAFLRDHHDEISGVSKGSGPLPEAKKINPKTPLPTTTQSMVKAIPKPPFPSANQPVIHGHNTPDAEKKVTITPVATPVLLGNKSAHIE